MRQMIKLTERALQQKTAHATAPTTTTDVPESLRVPLYTNKNTRQTRSMTPPNPQLPQLSTPSVPRVDQFTKTTHKNRTKKHKNKSQETALADNIRPQKQAAEAPPVRRKRARTKFDKIGKQNTNRIRIDSRCGHSTAGKRRPPSFGVHGHRNQQASHLKKTYGGPKI